MSSEAAIVVDGLRKKFCRSLRRSLWYGVKDLSSEMVGRSRQHRELREGEFWAIDDISFELRRGDSLGLIGPNGAGKTTLLRMLSGLIKPDGGRIEVRGRMQALIALGAGFNPILTGRENIYVNAAVLGISKVDIDRQLEEIVDFSGIEEFIDAPVQSYSSGMVVRLGFSVAIHMRPDILLVDEVLAVGDVPFRAKCARKLAELKDRGVPWVLVSHDMGTIRNQANKVMVLERGRCTFLGDPDEAISNYLFSVSETGYFGTEGEEAGHEVESAADRPLIRAVRLLDESGKEQEAFQTAEALVVEIEYESPVRLESPAFGIAFYGGDGACYTGINTRISGYEIEAIEGRGTLTFRLPHLPFLPGIYRVRVDLHDQYMGTCDRKQEAAFLRVSGGLFNAGMFYADHEWSHRS